MKIQTIKSAMVDKYNVQPPACVVDTVYQGAIISNEIYKQILQEIKVLLKDALNLDKTNVEQSFDNFYKILDKISEVE